MNEEGIVKFYIILENEIPRITKPPKLIYKPSIAVMREQILRTLYIKNWDEFINDNRIIEVKLDLESLK